MNVNLTPSVRAYCLERIRQLKHYTQPQTAAIDELERIVTLCDGLEKQAEFLNDFVAKAVGK